MMINVGNDIIFYNIRYWNKEKLLDACGNTSKCNKLKYLDYTIIIGKGHFKNEYLKNYGKIALLTCITNSTISRSLPPVLSSVQIETKTWNKSY